MTWDALYIGKAIFTTLNGIEGISTRIYPLRIPQETPLGNDAAISYYVISTSPEDVKDSRSLVDTVRIQVSIFAQSYATLNTIANLVRDALDGLTGEIGGCSVDSARFMDENELYEDEVNLYHIAQDYSIRVKNGSSINQNDMTSAVYTLTGDYTWTALIPAGYLIEYMIFDETSGNTAQISAGTTAGDNNVFSQEAITGGGLTVININKTFSKTAATTVYINHSQDGDGWNRATVNVWAQLRKFV
jgi:hypothetical protein